MPVGHGPFLFDIVKRFFSGCSFYLFIVVQTFGEGFDDLPFSIGDVPFFKELIFSRHCVFT